MKEIVAAPSPAIADRVVGAAGAIAATAAVTKEVPTTPEGAELFVAVTTERIKRVASAAVRV